MAMRLTWCILLVAIVLVLGCNNKPEDTPAPKYTGPIKLVAMGVAGPVESEKDLPPAVKPSKDEVTALAKEFLAKQLQGKEVEIASVSDPIDPPHNERKRDHDLVIYAVTYHADGPDGKQTHTNMLLMVGREHIPGAAGKKLAVHGSLNEAAKIRERMGDDWYEKEWKGKHHLGDPSTKKG
jgi:hypothetical protein